MTPELEKMMDESLELLNADKTVLFVFEDMYQVNDHFQAIIDWLNEHGLKTRRRFGQGVYMKTGMVYFVGADTHAKVDEDGNETFIQTRGAAKEFDMRPYASEWIRKIGLEGKLRGIKKVTKCSSSPEEDCLGGCENGCKRKIAA